MARTIGKIKIRKLKALVRNIHEKNYKLGLITLLSDVVNKVPEDWRDTWESAWAEIERIIMDELLKITLED